MAVIRRKRSANVKKRRLLRWSMLLCALVPTALAAVYVYLWAAKKTPPPLPLLYAALAAGALGALAFRVLRTRAAILTSGLDGERVTAALLKALPREYRVLLNPVYVVRGQVMELDAVVAGKNGVFIVETKNHTGYISGEAGAELWEQKKARGTKKMKNPLFQLERQMRLTKQLLSDAKLSCPLAGFVFFANPKATVDVADARVFTDAGALREAILAPPAPDPPLDAAAVLKLLEEKCE